METIILQCSAANRMISMLFTETTLNKFVYETPQVYAGSNTKNTHSNLDGINHHPLQSLCLVKMVVYEICIIFIIISIASDAFIPWFLLRLGFLAPL